MRPFWSQSVKHRRSLVQLIRVRLFDHVTHQLLQDQAESNKYLTNVHSESAFESTVETMLACFSRRAGTLYLLLERT